MKTADSIFPKKIFIGGAVRSPIGRFGGTLKSISAPRLAAAVLKAARERIETPAPDYVFLGHARQAGAGPNPARQATVFSGLPENVPATTLNQACASGMTAIFAAVEKLSLGKATSVWAGGVESMSNTPYLIPEARWGTKMGNFKLVDGMTQDGFHCPMADMVMGQTVDMFIAQELKIGRTAQDQYALNSQTRAAQAWDAGYFKNEIVPIAFDLGKQKIVFEKDEHLRPETSLESLAKLPPVFDRNTGTITAGNASGITDGAAFAHIGLEKLDSTQAEILDFETVALDPRRMGLAPIPAIENLLRRQNLKIADLEAIEINEAFAAQILACQTALEIPEAKLNAWGGSIAIGHPIGASGCRVVVTLLNRLRGKSGALGLAALCVSGGQGVALLLRAI